MRRSILISTIMAATVALLGACDQKTPENKPPVATPTPVATASPIATASPVASPSASPAKTGEVKSTDGKNVNGDVNKEVKPAETPKAK